jgi:hypothetical protein
MAILGDLVAVLLNVLALALIGALAYYRLKDWRVFNGLVKVRRIRDVGFGAMLILIIASGLGFFVRAMLHGG